MEPAVEQAPTISLDSLGRDPISAIAAFLTGKEMCGVACLCDAWRWVGRASRADKAWERCQFRRLFAYMRSRFPKCRLIRKQSDLLKKIHKSDQDYEEALPILAFETVKRVTFSDPSDPDSFSLARWRRCCDSNMSFVREACIRMFKDRQEPDYRGAIYFLAPGCLQLFPEAAIMEQLCSMLDDASSVVSVKVRDYLDTLGAFHEKKGRPFPEAFSKAIIACDDRREAAAAAQFAAIQLRLTKLISEGTAELRFGAEGFYVCEDLDQLECKDGSVYANADRFEWGLGEPGDHWAELHYRISYLKRKRDKRLLAWFVSKEDDSEDEED